jgi:hypothetical protein
MLVTGHKLVVGLPSFHTQNKQVYKSTACVCVDVYIRVPLPACENSETLLKLCMTFVVPETISTSYFLICCYQQHEYVRN